MKLKDTKNYDDSRQLHIEDYFHENRVELEDNEKVPNNSLTSKKKQDGRKAYEGMLLEKILDKDNMNTAFKRVKKNKGSHGIDKLTVDELLEYLKEHGEKLKEDILMGNYSPKAVRRVEIPKENGKKRKLGIPTVVDRVIQQAIHQILSPIFEEVFSDNSFGFRPMRSAHDALKKSKGYINDGNTWVIDIDLSSFFDTVNHDKLIGLIYKEVKDKRVISLIRKYMQAGVLENGVFSKTSEGVPQGGPLSPLLSNVMLNELDKELESRNLHFVRYADDVNVYVKSRKAAKRVMHSITSFIEIKLKLVVNKEKSAVDRPWKRKFLGYSFYYFNGKVNFRVHEKSVEKLIAKLKSLSGRNKIKDMKSTFIKLKQTITGWVNYFKMAHMKTVLKKIDGWLRRRIRMAYWKRWKRVRTRIKNLKSLGLKENDAIKFANTRKSYWRTSKSPILSTTITNARLKKSGLVSLSETYAKVS